MTKKLLITLLILAIVSGVVIGGIFTWRYWWPSRKTIEDETANWKTYINKEYGFEIKYPQEWTTKEEVKKNIDLIKKKYRFDIFYPEDITITGPYGNVAVEFFVHDDNDKFFAQQLDLLKRDSTLTIEEITMNGVKGFRGTAYQQIGKAKSMYISELFPDEEDQGIFRISVWTIDLDKEIYQEQTRLIIATFKFIE